MDTYYISLDLTQAATSAPFTSATIRFSGAELVATTFVQIGADSIEDARLNGAAAKEAAWQIIVSGSALSAKLVQATASGFWQPEQLELTAPYVGRYFAEIGGMPADRGQTAAAAIARAAYPSYAIQPSTLSLAERLPSGDELDDNLRRILVDRTDELRIALAARKAAG